MGVIEIKQEQVKTHSLYGRVRFILDYDNKYKPIANDIIEITGNCTKEKYSKNTLLEKRDLNILTSSSKKDLSMFKDWIYSNYDKLNASSCSTLSFKNEIEVLSTITIDDFATIDIHPFSCNNMYEAQQNKIKRTDKYNNWCNNFPVEELFKFKDVDFNKPVFVWYHFKCLPSYDIENLLKPTSDKLCSYLAATDENFKYFRADGEYINNYKDGKIYIFICNVEEKTSLF